MIAPVSVASVLFLALVVTPARASGETEVAVPNVRVGDSWTYRVTDLRTHAELSPRTFIVSKIDETTIDTDIRGGPRPSQAFNRDWSGRNYIRSYSFPLQVGKKWQSNPTFQNQECGETQALIDAEVATWEDVTVPAGTFRALRIEHSGTWTAPKCGTGRTVLRFWYAPDVRRHVKYEESWYNPRGQLNNGMRFELSAFELR